MTLKEEQLYGLELKSKLEELHKEMITTSETLDSFISLANSPGVSSKDISIAEGKKLQLDLDILGISRILSYPYMCKQDIISRLSDIIRSSDYPFALIQRDNGEDVIILATYKDLADLEKEHDLSKVTDIQELDISKVQFSITK